MRQANKAITLCFLCGVLSILAGCGIGYNRTLFITKTNVGFEASAEPPTFELDISRLEGTVGPQFENGKKLPVMASFKFSNRGAFSPSIGSTFATGDAATTMAALYNAATPGTGWEERADMVFERNNKTLKTKSTLSLNAEPTAMSWLPSWLDWLRPEFQKKDVRPVFFGTNTSLGLNVAWSGMTGGFPDSAKLGYNRTELALVPIAIEAKSGKDKNNRSTGITTFDMNMASLMATVDSGVSGITNSDGTPKLDSQHLQYFATGAAATLLSLQQDVRAAMLARLDPNKDAFRSQFGQLINKEGEVSLRAQIVMAHIYRGLESLMKDGDQKAGEHLQSLNDLGKIAPDEITTYSLGDGGTLVQEHKVHLHPNEKPDFVTFSNYRSDLVGSINVLSNALGQTTFQYKPLGGDDAKAVTNEQKADLTEKLSRLRKLKEDLIARVASNSSAAAAIQYYQSLLTTN